MVKKNLFLHLCLFSILTSCASYTQETVEMRSNFKRNRYQEALSLLEGSALKDQERNRLLYHLEKGMILDRLGEKEKSRKVFIEADKIADELYTTSISKTAVTFIYNDSAADYDGEDYEKVAIHTILALSFLEDNNLNAARVSAKKINNKLYEINQKYDDNKNAYGVDAFALYLSGMIYEAKGDESAAIIDYKRALETYGESYKKLFRLDPPEALVRSLYALAERKNRSNIIQDLEKKWSQYLPRRKEWLDEYEKSGEVVIIHEIGNISPKTAQEFVFGFGKQVIRFSFPTIKSYPMNVGKTGVMVEGKSFYKAELAEDFDAIAETTLNDRKGRMLAKNAARLLAKGQLTEEAHKRYGPVAGLAANIFSAVTETADTRGWTLLPRNFYITRVRLSPGTHKIKVYNDGNLSEIETVQVKKGKMQFLRIYPKARN